MSTKYLKAKYQNGANLKSVCWSKYTSLAFSFLKIILLFQMIFKNNLHFLCALWSKTIKLKQMSKFKHLFYLILLKFQLPTILLNQVIHEVSFS